ncbi:MAG: succinylglutamate desuccinylase/aspartoacylase family protein [Chlamydiia bacterium]|nr:succinylglutamate desuccinylase/aspartoacylase family protein [Chlamydiia bacterium]
MKNRPFVLSNVEIQPGERVTLALPTPQIYTCAPLHIPMHVIHGKKAGPVLVVCGTFYGDEINGISIIKRLLQLSSVKALHGTLIAIPVINVYGLINRTRLLPDGHDLMNSFPGVEQGSFASRLAYLIYHEVLHQCSHSLIIRTGGPHHYKVPHVYYQKDDQESKRLASVFGAPAIQSLKNLDDIFSMKQRSPSHTTLMYEGGEAHRPDEWTVRLGVKGILNVLRELKMLRAKAESKKPPRPPSEIATSHWVRASGSGLYHFQEKLGSWVEEGQQLGIITDPFGTEQTYKIIAPEEGIITGINTHTLVYEGQGIIQLGAGTNLQEPNFPTIEGFQHPEPGAV